MQGQAKRAVGRVTSLRAKTQKSLCSEQPGAEAAVWRNMFVLVYWVRKRCLYLYTSYILCSFETNARVLLYVEFKTVFWEMVLQANDTLFKEQVKTLESNQSVFLVCSWCVFFSLAWAECLWKSSALYPIVRVLDLQVHIGKFRGIPLYNKKRLRTLVCHWAWHGLCGLSIASRARRLKLLPSST